MRDLCWRSRNHLRRRTREAPLLTSPQETKHPQIRSRTPPTDCADAERNLREMWSRVRQWVAEKRNRSPDCEAGERQQFSRSVHRENWVHSIPAPPLYTSFLVEERDPFESFRLRHQHCRLSIEIGFRTNRHTCGAP